MFKPFLFLLPVLALVLSSCSGNGGQPEQEYVFTPPVEDTVDPNTPFYPFHDYIRSQITYVDTMPFGIEKRIEINGKLTDSGFISKEYFKEMANSFLEIDPNSPALKPSYTENSFTDLTTNRITFSISTKKSDLPLQNADILLNAENQKVKNVLLKKYIHSPDSTILQYLVWVDKMHFQISETITRKNQASYTRVTRVVWDKPLE
jgi:hypothetical protein